MWNAWNAWNGSRRDFLRVGAATAALAATSLIDSRARRASAYVPSADEVPHGDRPPGDKSVQVLHPRNRVPLSFIIDDSTCLVNMGKYCMPQFRAAWPQRPEYWKPWKEWPDEIPDAFLREFGEFCAAQGVRGKFSLVPYPACVGWLDRELPGWTRKELQESLKLVRDVYVPNWDITPEMVTHTHVIDLKTGRPLDPPTSATMENSYPPAKKSADELAAYIAYALQILKNAEIPATGVTTPGGFGNACKAELSQAMGQALRDVFQTEIPFYFKYIADGKDEDTAPRLEHVEGSDTDHRNLVVNVPGSTGDLFGSWDGDQVPAPDKYATADASAGRMVDLIEAGQPAVMFGHWAGFYSNGSKRGFEACKTVVTAINGKYRDRTVWMKSSEMARYQAARELTRIERAEGRVTLAAPYACPMFTLRLGGAGGGPPKVGQDGKAVPLEEVKEMRDLRAGTWVQEKDGVVACFDLPKGKATVNV